MKEPETTLRTRPGTLLLLLIASIILLNCQKPKDLYSENAMTTLKRLDTAEYLIPLNELDTDRYALIDVRNPYDFEKGHLPGAINIYSPDLFNQDNQKVLNEDLPSEKALLLYGNDPNQTLPVFMILYQTDIRPVKILECKSYFEKDEFKTSPFKVENKTPDIRAFIEKSKESASAKPATRQAVRSTPKKVLPSKKKKKKMPEGGC